MLRLRGGDGPSSMNAIFSLFVKSTLGSRYSKDCRSWLPIHFNSIATNSIFHSHEVVSGYCDTQVDVNHPYLFNLRFLKTNFNPNWSANKKTLVG